MKIRQIRITTQNIDIPQENDCYIAPDDLINTIKKENMLGGLPFGLPELVDAIKQFKKGDDTEMPKM
jgi:hypothetical protein